jgi:hypothetical protein
VFRPHTSVVRKEIGFDSRTDLWFGRWACMPWEATDPCKVGAMGSTPIRSTETVSGSWSNGTTPLWHGGNPGSIPGGSTETEGIRIGLGSCVLSSRPGYGVWGSILRPSAGYGSMVKRTSSLASNKVFRVRFLVGLLVHTEGQPDWRRAPVGSRPGVRIAPCGFDSRSFRYGWAR